MKLKLSILLSLEIILIAILVIGTLNLLDKSISDFSFNLSFSVIANRSRLEDVTKTPQHIFISTNTFVATAFPITKTSTLTPTKTPTLTGTPVRLPTDKPTSTLVPLTNQWKSVNISQGLRSVPVAIHGVWFGPVEYLNFSEAERGKLLTINVDSGVKELRIELWGGKIDINENSWWNIHPQRALSTGTGDNPVIEPNPNLTWRIIPGDYTVFFASYSSDGKIPDYLIKYKIKVTD